MTGTPAKAAVLREFNAPISVEQVDYRPPTARRVLIRTGAAPFCSTDVTNWRGKLGKVLPTILGHAAMGVIEAVGPEVEHLRIGQRVIVPGTPECGVCFYCGIGRPDQCSELFDRPGRSATSDGYQPVADGADGGPVTAAGLVGGYSQLMRMHESQVFPVESELPDEQLSLLGCGVTSGAGSVFNAAQVAPGESVVVIGLGHLGLWTVQAARVAGASEIIAVDPITARRELAGALGATRLVDPTADDAISAVHAVTGGRGADHVIETAGPPEAAELAPRLSRRAGTIVFTGVKQIGTTVTFDQPAISVDGRRIIGTQNGQVHMRRDLPRFIRLIESGAMTAEPIITRRYSLEQIDEALANSRDHVDVCGVLMPPW